MTKSFQPKLQTSTQKF